MLVNGCMRDYSAHTCKSHPFRARANLKERDTGKHTVLRFLAHLPCMFVKWRVGGCFCLHYWSWSVCLMSIYTPLWHHTRMELIHMWVSSLTTCWRDPWFLLSFDCTNDVYSLTSQLHLSHKRVRRQSRKYVYNANRPCPCLSVQRHVLAAHALNAITEAHKSVIETHDNRIDEPFMLRHPHPNAIFSSRILYTFHYVAIATAA